MFDFRDFLEVSKRIEASNCINDEAFRRTAVSRAYYGAYNVTNERLNELSPSGIELTNEKGGHINFWRVCSKISQVKRLKDVPENGARLLDLRKTADYASVKRTSKFDVKMANKLAVRIIEQIDLAKSN